MLISLKLHSALLQLFRRYVELGDLSKASNGHRIRIRIYLLFIYIYKYFRFVYRRDFKLFLPSTLGRLLPIQSVYINNKLHFIERMHNLFNLIQGRMMIGIMTASFYSRDNTIPAVTTNWCCKSKGNWVKLGIPHLSSDSLIWFTWLKCTKRKPLKSNRNTIDDCSTSISTDWAAAWERSTGNCKIFGKDLLGLH